MWYMMKIGKSNSFFMLSSLILKWRIYSGGARSLVDQSLTHFCYGNEMFLFDDGSVVLLVARAQESFWVTERLLLNM